MPAECESAESAEALKAICASIAWRALTLPHQQYAGNAHADYHDKHDELDQCLTMFGVPCLTRNPEPRTLNPELPLRMHITRLYLATDACICRSTRSIVPTVPCVAVEVIW